MIFQPAEENFQGAYQVIEAGGLDGVSAIIGYHNNPHLKPGQIGLRSGAIMAGVEQFRVDVKGVSSHAARPDLGVDTVLVTTTIINNLQQIVARTVSPFESAVLSVTHIEVGNTWNVLPAAGFSKERFVPLSLRFVKMSLLVLKRSFRRQQTSLVLKLTLLGAIHLT